MPRHFIGFVAGDCIGRGLPGRPRPLPAHAADGGAAEGIGHAHDFASLVQAGDYPRPNLAPFGLRGLNRL